MFSENFVFKEMHITDYLNLKMEAIGPCKAQLLTAKRI